MPTYIALLKWTEKGIAAIKGSPSRLDAGRQAFKQAGMEIKEAYLTMGRYDLVCLIDAPDDETLAKGMLSLAVLLHRPSRWFIILTTYRPLETAARRGRLDADPFPSARG